ncbi:MULTISPECIES: hypothetical protein [Streptomyces]|uniref:GerMN domain-containing protein n=1 Tax=Streptomyces cremeus TaxID=66881 RepID=A0ABV5PEM5_STRCM
MSHGRGRRWARAAGPLAALVLTGCGIRETDVIEAGGPATVDYLSDASVDALLFFRLPHGALAPAARPLGTHADADNGFRSRPASTERVMSALLGGPSKAERAAGLGTALPRTAGRVELRESATSDEIALTLPFSPAGLDGTALRQLICTAAYSRDRAGLATVRLTGPDGVSETGACGLGLPAGDRDG